uniref:Uncharacterized protein n=1 Tax=Echeneis naucrates TaxID=173247 RepID=A0A665WFI1_ECHNA
MTMVTDITDVSEACLTVSAQTSFNSLLTDRTSVSFWVMRSNSAPLNSGSIAYFPDVKKELAATPEEGRKDDKMKMAYNGWETPDTG